MSWNNLSLKGRILISYGLILMLTSALTVILIVRIVTLNTNVEQLNATVVRANNTAIQLTTHLATAQQLVNRYLQQPQRTYFREANQALADLESAIEAARMNLVHPGDQQSLDAFAIQVATYKQAFQDLSTQLAEQRTLREDLSLHLFRSGTMLNEIMSTYPLEDSADPAVLVALAEAQTNLQAAKLQSDRLLLDRSPEARVLEQLDTAARISQPYTEQPDIGQTMQAALVEINQAYAVTRLLVANVAQTQLQGEDLVNQQASDLKQQADSIAQNALVQLENATVDLERQTLRTQQIAGIMLIMALLVAVGTGLFLAQTITRPVQGLVAATRQINQGNYDIHLAQHDGSEIGQLTQSFNEMATAIKQERAEVLRQQQDLAEHNRALEQALRDIETATAAREALAATVRIMSVPVIGVMEGVIVLPLVGDIDEQRAKTLMERLLDGVQAQRAHIAILDLTGVSSVNVSLVSGLMQAVQAAELLGARCILVGISPEMAQTLVSSSFDLQALNTRADLQSAIQYALRVMGQTNHHLPGNTSESNNGKRKASVSATLFSLQNP